MSGDECGCGDDGCVRGLATVTRFASDSNQDAIALRTCSLGVIPVNVSRSAIRRYVLSGSLTVIARIRSMRSIV